MVREGFGPGKEAIEAISREVENNKMKFNVYESDLLYKSLMSKPGYVYIMTNKNHSVLYTGVTSDLGTRLIQHKSGYFSNSFTALYNVEILVYFEKSASIEDAIAREKQIKAGSRKKKINLITRMNPEWKDLSGITF